jgi:hypothetical protein
VTPRILLLQAAAVAASLLHVLLDVWLGFFGRPPEITVGRALTFLSIALLYAWWQSPIAAATSGVRGAMLALAILAGVWVLLGQGIAGVAYCFPPCALAAPWADVAHLASLVFGGWAAWAAWRAYRSMSGETQLAPAATAVVLIVITFALQAANVTLVPPR